MGFEKEMESLRGEIDKIDIKLVELLNSRLELVADVGVLKNKNKRSVYDPAREREIISRVCRYAKNRGLRKINEKIAKNVFYEIFAASRDLESVEKIGFSGPEMGVLHQVAVERFGSLNEYVKLGSNRLVFESIKKGEIKYGVAPLEDNSGGIVWETVELLTWFNLKIVSKLSSGLACCLASNVDNPGNIKRVYVSEEFLRWSDTILDHCELNNPKVIYARSNEEAARSASEDKDSAVICTTVLAKHHGLQVVFDKIHNGLVNPNGSFVVIGESSKSCSNNNASIFVNKKGGREDIASLTGWLYKNVPAVLATHSKSKWLGNYVDLSLYAELNASTNDMSIESKLVSINSSFAWLGSYPVC